MNAPTGDDPPVVVAVDGTPGSAGALRWATREAALRGRPLLLVNVVRETPVGAAADERWAEGKALLTATARSVKAVAGAPATATALVDGGAVIDGLVAACDGAELLAIGRERRHGLERLVAGAVVVGVANRVACPVVVVPSFWTGTPPHGRILVAIKSAGHAAELFSQAFAAATRLDAAITVLSAPGPTGLAEDRADATALLEGLLADWRVAHPDVPVEVRVEPGDPAAVIVTAAARHDLVLLARRDRPRSSSGRLGVVAQGVLRACESPVEIVPAGRRAADVPEPDLVLEQAGAPLT